MTILLIVIVGIVLVISLGTGFTMFILFRSGQQIVPNRTVQPATPLPVKFHWRYIMLPIAVFLLSIALLVYFYRLLPADVAYHFQPDGSPDEWAGRGTLALWTILPQFFLTLLALGVAWGITRLGSLLEGSSFNLNMLASTMGNMIALPQIILFFALLDIFSYNTYQIRILPLWAITVIVMGLGTVFLGIFFVRTIRQVRSSQ